MFQALPILGRDGTLANVESDSPAAGQAQLKTGNRVVGTPADQIIVLGNSLAGYAQTKSGHRVVFMIAAGNVPISTPEEFLTDRRAVSLCDATFCAHRCRRKSRAPMHS